jgi:hypothetical protein
MRGLIRLLVVFTAVAGLCVGGTQVASAGPSADGSYLQVAQFGHITHRVCDNHPFWVEFVNTNVFNLALLDFDIRSKSSGQILRSDYILLGGGDGAPFGAVRETRLGARHDGPALIRFDYTFPEDFGGHQRGSYSIDVVPCPA